MPKKIALITGVTGQDGSYLSDFLIKKNYTVHGLVRRSSIVKTDRIDHLFYNKSIYGKRFFLHYGDMTDDFSIFNLINIIKPHEIYNLAAQSHVKVSFELPLYTSDVDAFGTLRILEAVRSLKLKSKIYQASTSELYGDTEYKNMNEKTPFNPVSPYGVSKLYSYKIIEVYRNAYNLFACNGILFNHESPRRGETFVTSKIVNGLADYLTNKKYFELGNLEAIRDWGHARDFVEGMWLMLQQNKPDDYVLSTGKTYSVRDFLYECLNQLNIKFKVFNKKNVEYIIDKSNNKTICRTNKRLLRPNEVPYLKGDYKKAKTKLGWSPKVTFKQLISEMLQAKFIKN